MRQLKITRPIPKENLSPEELEKRQERFNRIMNQLPGRNWKNEMELKTDLSIYLFQFCEKFYKYTPKKTF